MKITMSTTIRELIEDLSSNREEGVTTVAIHAEREGDEIPNNVTIMVTDNQELRATLEKLYEEF